MGGRSHPAAGASARKLALAGRRKHLDRIRLPARRLFSRYLNLEIRPIIDRKIGRWYFALNPTLNRSFHGPSVSQGVTFSPNAKFSYDFTPKIAGGREYYAAYGSLDGFDALRDQQRQFFPARDIDFAPQWEFNFGVAGITLKPE